MHKGKCFCGKVAVEAQGDPQLMAYCHCESCRHWSAGPVNGAVLWKEEDVSVVEGREFLKTYNKTAGSTRTWCSECGGHIMTVHPKGGVVDLYHAITPSVRFDPKFHINYGEAVLKIADGLPKFKDTPEDFGGTGEMIED